MTLWYYVRCLGFVPFLLVPLYCHSGEWPQILGPARNGVAADDEVVAKTWPSAGPKVVWQREVGEGYSGVAVIASEAYLFHREGSQEVVEQLDALTGKTGWKKGFATDYESTIAPDSGPRCVPTCHGDAVFVLGATGQLVCLARADGKVRWSRSIRDDYSAPEGYFGCGSSPIVVDDKLIVNVGAKGAGVVAFDAKTGKTVWQVTNENASYSSPVIGNLNTQSIAYVLARLQLLCIDPATGKLLAAAPFGMRGPTVNGANPVVVDDAVLLTASYGIGAVKLKLDDGRMTEVWRLDEGLSSQYTTPIVSQGVIYAIDGRQDAGAAHLRALDWETGKVLWTKEQFGYATMILAGRTLVILTTEGELVLVEATKDQYRELARARVLDGTARPLPALSNGRLYVRDDKVLKCLEMSGK